jgi:hypothetical protein
LASQHAGWLEDVADWEGEREGGEVRRMAGRMLLLSILAIEGAAVVVRGWLKLGGLRSWLIASENR